VIVGLKDPIDPATGKPQVDDKNPNPALKKRPDDRPAAVQRHARPPRQMSGQIYMRRRLHLRKQHLVTGPDTLWVEGCVGALCGGETWTRVGR